MVGAEPALRAGCRAPGSGPHSRSSVCESRHRRTRTPCKARGSAPCHTISGPVLRVLPRIGQCSRSSCFLAHESRASAAAVNDMPPNPLLLRTGHDRRASSGVVTARRRTTRSASQKRLATTLPQWKSMALATVAQSASLRRSTRRESSRATARTVRFFPVRLSAFP